MDSHNHSRFTLDLLPGEDHPVTRQALTPTATTSMLLTDDPEPWMPDTPRSQAVSPAPTPPPMSPVQPTLAVAGHTFCQFCGGRVAPDAVLCVSCGRLIKGFHLNAPQSTETKPVSPGLFGVAVILTLLFPLAGVFFGISGLTRKGQQGHGAALIVLSFVLFYLYWLGLTTWHH